MISGWRMQEDHGGTENAEVKVRSVRSRYGRGSLLLLV